MPSPSQVDRVLQMLSLSFKFTPLEYLQIFVTEVAILGNSSNYFVSHAEHKVNHLYSF